MNRRWIGVCSVLTLIMVCGVDAAGCVGAVTSGKANDQRQRLPGVDGGINNVDVPDDAGAAGRDADLGGEDGDGDGDVQTDDAGGQPSGDGGGQTDGGRVTVSNPPPRDGGNPPPLNPDPPAANPCIAAGTCPVGTWIDVTPKAVDLTSKLSCDNFGTLSVQADPLHPGHFYTLFMCQGIWKTTDYGSNWKLVSTGRQGAAAGDCAGGLTVPPYYTGTVPTVYIACIRGEGTGFWSSTNGGVDWTRYTVGPGKERQDFYPPVVDPYDPNHLLMAGHEFNMVVESFDGGHSWSEIAMEPAMHEDGGTAGIFFVDTGQAATTAKTFLWVAQQSAKFGTWRTTSGGTSWTRVDSNEHPHGTCQIYQPNTSGVVFMAGIYSALGSGVLRSTDYGATWTHVGPNAGQAAVFGTSKNLYAMNSAAVAPASSFDPGLQMAPVPGTGTWTAPGTPPEMRIGAAQAAVANDGTHNVILTANWGAGLWRYVEP